MKQRIIWSLTIFSSLLLVACFIFVSTEQMDNVFEHFTAKRLFRVDNSMLSDPGIHLILAGTGSPAYDPIRNPACVAVIAGGEFLLFDSGDGCTKTLDSMDLPITMINNVFLTHLHSDHVNGLGQLISYTWIQGRKNTIDVYGPPGVDSVVNGFAAAAKEDILIRSDSSALFPLDPKLGVAIPHKFTYFEDGTPVVVWKKNGVTVKAFKNDHADVKTSCGYRIEFANRSVVISGDTVKNESVIQNAKNADVLIHESVNRELAEVAVKVLRKSSISSRTWMADQISRVINHHTGTLEVAEVAQAAGVGKLVLYHVIPGIPDNWLLRRKYVKGMSSIYSGSIFIAKDKDRFYLEPKL